MMTFLRNVAKLRSREEAFIAALDQLRRGLKTFAAQLGDDAGGGEDAATLRENLLHVDERLHYQYTANVSVHSRQLGELIRHLFEAAHDLLDRSPPALGGEVIVLARQCLEVAGRGLLEYRGREARRAAAKAKRLQKHLQRGTRKNALTDAMREILADPGNFSLQEFGDPSA